MNLALIDLEFGRVELGCSKATFALSVNTEPDE